jgi:thiamine biosynthesis lipoprotein
MVLFLTLLLGSCSFKKEILFSGKTMGTTYHIKVVTGFFQNTNQLKNKIDSRLERINRSMSIYIEDSEISRFNQKTSINKAFYPSADFMNVIAVAQNLYELTGGAWDGTIKPLIDLWGFGSSVRSKKRIPDTMEIVSILSEIGFNHIEISKNGYFFKKKACISIDLSSIAKGYGVDAVAALIKGSGFENFLVEIGGEVFASGFRADGKQWRVGINRPETGSPSDCVYKVITIHDKALATSGDYRNFFEMEGKRYSHVIDPRTGYPVSNGVVSVSIIADNCTLADGLATAVMVLGYQKGIELVDRLNGVECLIIVQQDNDSLINHYSKGFQRKGEQKG